MKPYLLKILSHIPEKKSCFKESGFTFDYVRLTWFLEIREKHIEISYIERYLGSSWKKVRLTKPAAGYLKSQKWSVRRYISPDCKLQLAI